MGTVFPVEFAILVPSDGSPERLLQGFTRNVSESGMCIELKSFGKEVERKLSDPAASLKLTINPSFSKNPIFAAARIVWLKKEEGPQAARYFIGVDYETIDSSSQKRLIGHARRMRQVPRIIGAVGLLLLTALTALAVHDRMLMRENIQLAQEVREDALKKSKVAGNLVTLSESRRSLEMELEKLRSENERLEKAVEGMNKEVSVKVTYENELLKSREREAGIRKELERIQSSQTQLRESYHALEETGRKGSETALVWMSHWLVSHRNVKTGLVASFEGDASLEDTAFSYDQSLVAQAFLLSGEAEKAEAIFSFYDSRARRVNGAYFNAYDTANGEPREMIVRTGPNLWLGIAVLQYGRTVNSRRFIPMARRLGDWALRLQDGEGGLLGGPDVSWYSTEHNLDAYAFFGMLAEVTGEESYRRAQEKTLTWLKKYAYSNKNGGVNRGKGDATIATDTLAWSIAALGPAKLEEMGFDPESILGFAEEHCGVKVDFQIPGGQKLEVQGFDFAKAQNLARGGVISTEWTSQMAVSYQVMARYFKAAGNLEKAGRYHEKADFYMSELQKMLIVSPSRTGQGRGCLPYASADNVDTGHGWRTPNGSRTGSVAGTAYGFFAGKRYNPFELSKKNVVRQAHHEGDEHAGL